MRRLLLAIVIAASAASCKDNEPKVVEVKPGTSVEASLERVVQGSPLERRAAITAAADDLALAQSDPRRLAEAALAGAPAPTRVSHSRAATRMRGLDANGLVNAARQARLDALADLRKSLTEEAAAADAASRSEVLPGLSVSGGVDADGTVRVSFRNETDRDVALAIVQAVSPGFDKGKPVEAAIRFPEPVRPGQTVEASAKGSAGRQPLAVAKTSGAALLHAVSATGEPLRTVPSLSPKAAQEAGARIAVRVSAIDAAIAKLQKP